MKRPGLAVQVTIGLILGGLYAWLAVENDWAQFTMDWINPFGDIFISLLKMIAVPLVLFSIISGIISLKDISKLGRLGVKTLSAYIITTFLAVTVGLIVVNLFSPGEKQDDKIRVENRISYELWVESNDKVEFKDEIRLSKDPANKAILESVKSRMSQEQLNAWVSDKVSKREAQQDVGPLNALKDVFSSNIFKSLADSHMLQIIFFALFFGVMLIMIPAERAKPVIALVDGLNDVFIMMITVMMKAMPVFVFALMAGQVVKAAGSDPVKFAELLDFYLIYSLVVVCGLGLVVFLIYPFIVKLLGGIGYTTFFKSMRDAQITAFSTSSSVATLPVTMRCIEDNLGVSKSVSSFVLPIGATVNMDGTSLYQAVAVVALAQFHMVDLGVMEQLVIVGTATLASIGAAAVPSAGLVLMMVVLESVGLNPLWIALIFPIDRILDMCRTVVNVTGDATIAAVIAKSEGELADTSVNR